MSLVSQGVSYGGATGTIVIPRPAGAAAGSVVVVCIGIKVTRTNTGGYGTYRTVTTPPGWTQLTLLEQYSGGTSPGLSLYCLYKLIAAGETEWSFQTSTASGLPWGYGYVAVCYGGTDQTTQVNVSATQITTPASTTATAPSVTTTVTNTRLLTILATALDTTPTTPAGETRLAAVPLVTGWYDANGTLAVFDQGIAATGATGTRTSTVASGETLAISIAIEPDQSNPTATLSGFTVAAGFGVPSFLQDSPPSAVDTLLANPSDSLVRVVAKLNPFDQDSRAEVPTYVGDQLGGARDLPAGIREILVDDLKIERSIFANNTLGGKGTIALGTLKLLGGDGAIDGYGAYAWDHRDVELWIGGRTPQGYELAWSEYRKFTKAKSTAPQVGLDEVEIPLQDRGAILDRWVQLNRYAGTGGTEGGADLAGKPKPLGLGKVQNAEPQLLSLVPLVYQFHDGSTGAARSLDAVYDKGIQLASSAYTVDLSAGTFTLLTNPAGRITCDFTGPSAAGDTAGKFVKWLTSSAGVGPLTCPNDFASDYFLSYDASQTAQLGLYLRDDTKIADALDLVVAPLGYWAWSRLGQLIVGTVSIPFGQFDLDIQPWEVRTIEQQATANPYCRVAVGWGRNWTKQDPGELAGSAIASAHGLFVVQEYRTAYYPVAGRDATVLEAYPTAEERQVIPTLIVNEADAAQASADCFAIYGKPWLVFDVDVGPRALGTDLGKVQRLTFSRFALSRGTLFRLLRMVETTSTVTLTLWALALPTLMVYDDTYVMQFDTGEWMQF